jgi:tRNA-2-methylthio-N6-dimethylallyladenosine synthase
MPYLHLPVQSGSDRILTAMNRHYTQKSYLELVERIRDAIPGIALSTDIIVGFPGETDEDFERTLEVVREAAYDQAFTFIYSPREGTPAARLTERVDREVSQERFDRLVELVQASAYRNALPYVGTRQQVLIEGVSKRDASVLSGRTPTNKVVHAPIPAGHSAENYTGRIIGVDVDHAQTWFLSGQVAGTQE